MLNLQGKRYKSRTVRHQCVGDMDDEVNKLLSEGWVVENDLILASLNPGCVYIRAMVLIDD